MLSLRTPAVLLAALLAPSSVVAQVSFNQIAITGGAAAGVDDGAEFDSFFSPSLNTSGDVAFESRLRTGTGGEVTIQNNQAIFGPISGTGSPLGLIARQDAPAPGVTDGAEFSSFSSPSLNASGNVAFSARLRTGTGPAVNSTAIFGPTSGAGSSLGLIARSGAPAPGVTDGAAFGSLQPPSLNASGDVAFSTSLTTGSGDVVGFNNNTAVFGPTSGAGSPLSPIAREGDTAPGVGDGAEFSVFGSVSLNASGDVAFSGGLRAGTGADVPLDNPGGIFGPTSGAGSPLGLIAREGNPAPGVDDGAVFGSELDFISLNASGDVVFEAFLRTGTGATVDNTNDIALFGPTSGAGSPLGAIAREGDTAPGVANGTEFSSFGFSSLNASGDVAFEAFLRGDAVNSNNNSALFTYVDGVFEVVVREGDLFTVTLPDGSDTEDRTVSRIDFSSAGLSDTGQLAFGLGFTDFTDGIFTTTLGEILALTGDYNGDGFVGQADLDLVLLNFGSTSLPEGFNTAALPGGAPFDELIGQNELDGVLLNFGSGTPSASFAVIPEPTTAVPLGFLTVLGATRRRRA